MSTPSDINDVAPNPPSEGVAGPSRRGPRPRSYGRPEMGRQTLASRPDTTPQTPRSSFAALVITLADAVDDDSPRVLTLMRQDGLRIEAQYFNRRVDPEIGSWVQVETIRKPDAEPDPNKDVPVNYVVTSSTAPQPDPNYVVLTVTEIPARDGITLGKVEDCLAQVLDTETDELTDGEAVTVYNLDEKVIPAGIYIRVVADDAGNLIAQNPARRNGVVRGLAEVNFDDTDGVVDVRITFSELADIAVSDVVTATNYIGYSGDRDGECYVYYHGDGTGNEDGTFDLMGARCPV